MKNIFLLIPLLFYNFHGFSQGLIEVDRVFPGSPEASAFAEYGKTPVNLYSGLVDVNLPLLELKGKDMDIQFNLTYHSAGNKVDEISSSIGLGWALNAGGVITRVVRGLNDDHVDGYIGANQRGLFINNNSVTSMTTSQRVNFVASVWDSEPDLYYFNVLGKSGSFTFDADGKVIMTPENDFKILPPFGPQSINNYWTLIDKEGNKYLFGVYNSEIEKVKIIRSSTGTSSNPVTTSYPNREYNSSWYLSSINTPGNGVFQYEYINGLKTSYTNISEEHNTLGNDGGYQITTTKTETLNPVVLNKVLSSIGYVELLSSNRSDLTNGKKITELKLYNNNSDLIKTIKLNHSYFNSKENCSDPECKRLKLLNVLENNIMKYEFEYNPVNLPKRGSPEIDHWGYYNQNNQTHLISRSDPLNINQYRLPNEVGTKANILEKIIYPTKGYTEFTFGLNYYGEGQSNLASGGLRIESTEDVSNNGIPIVTTYSYLNDNSSISSGIQFNLPNYTRTQLEIYTINGIEYSIENTIVSSSSYSELLDLNGSNIGYGNIIKNNANGGKQTLKYTNLISNPNTINASDYFSFYNSGSNTQQIDPFGSPFGYNSEDKSYQRGLLKEKILKNSNNQEIYHLWNNYAELTYSNPLETIGIKFQKAWVSQNFWEANAARYKVKNGNYRLINSIEKNIFNNDEVKVETNYEYSFSKPTLVTSEEVIYDNSDIRKTVYKYPNDLVGIEQYPYMNNLVSTNRISQPIITELYKGATKLSEEHITYSASPANENLLLPYEMYSKKGGININISNNEDRKIEFTKYENGKLIEYKLDNDKSVCIIWGYNHTYPIAKVENASYSQVSNQVSNLQTKSNNDYDRTIGSSGNEGLLRTALNALRDLLPNSMVTTFTYDPLIGVTSITDPKGYTTYYEYDDFNRLEQVKDDTGKILSKNEYHYKE